MSKFSTRAMILLQDVILEAVEKVFKLFESNELDFTRIQVTIVQTKAYLGSFLEEDDCENIDENDEIYDEFLNTLNEECEIMDAEEEFTEQSDVEEEADCNADIEEHLIEFENVNAEDSLKELLSQTEDAIHCNRKKIKFEGEEINVSKVELNAFKKH